MYGGTLERETALRSAAFPSTLLVECSCRNKVGFFAVQVNFYPIRWPKELL